MFPTTIWTRIHDAGESDAVALEEFAARYREPVLRFIERKGFRGRGAEDLTQEVFVRVLRGGVLAKADRHRGRFRSLLLTVTTHVLQDHLRRKREVVVEDLEPPDRDAEFDHAWALNLTDRALDRLREQGSPYFDVLRGHIAGEPQSRNRLWIARKKLAALIRHEVAMTCATPEQMEEEMAYLAQFLGPRRKAQGPGA